MLGLGEITFGGVESAEVANTAALAQIAKLIGVEAGALSTALTNKTIVTRGDSVTSSLTSVFAQLLAAATRRSRLLTACPPRRPTPYS